jgi:tartrate-resistant acid phosphatase type 5
MRAVVWACACVGLVLASCDGSDSLTDGSGGGPGQGAGGAGAASTTGSTTSAGGNAATTTTTGQGAGGGTPGEVVRFVALGDAGKANQGQLDVATAVAAKCAASGCDFVQLLGDNIYDSGPSSPTDRVFQTHFEVPYAAVEAPFFVVLGNHDYGGNGAGYEFGKGQHSVDYTALSDKWNLPAAFYHHAIKHVEFFALDTNMAMYSLADNQENTIPGWVAASTARWKIAFGHHPYRSNGPHGNAGDYDGVFIPPADGSDVKNLLDVAVCGTTDVYLSGHDHTLQWLTETCSGTELIVSGTGASATELEGDNPAHFQSLALGFLYVTIDGDTFTGEFIDTTGAVLFTRTLMK